MAELKLFGEKKQSPHFTKYIVGYIRKVLIVFNIKVERSPQETYIIVWVLTFGLSISNQKVQPDRRDFFELLRSAFTFSQIC